MCQEHCTLKIMIRIQNQSGLYRQSRCGRYAWLNSIKNQKNRKKSIDYLRKRLYYILIGL